MTAPQTLFYLGATGYIGSQVLVSVKRDPAVYAELKEYTLVALVRDPEDIKSQKLLKLWPGTVLVKGTLEDTAIIEEQAQKSNITFNAANSEHIPSVTGKLLFLISPTQRRKRSAAYLDEKQPLYIHISGLAVLSDNSRGEFVPEEDQIKYPDTTFNLNLTSEKNLHQAVDRLILAAATQKENPITALLAYPSTVYGVGEGIAFDTTVYRVLANIVIRAGVAGTWGPGHNRAGVIHIKDVGSAFTTIFKLVFEGKAKVNEEGFYFITAEDAEPVVWNRLAGEMGKIFHAEGLIKSPEVKPFPDAVVSLFGETGWGAFGGNWAGGIPVRLRAEGWAPVESNKLSIWESVSSEIQVVAENLKKGPITEWGGFSAA